MTRPTKTGLDPQGQTPADIEVMSAEEQVPAPGFKAAEDFVNARALEILREWANSLEIVEIVEEAERATAADAARKAAA